MMELVCTDIVYPTQNVLQFYTRTNMNTCAHTDIFKSTRIHTKSPLSEVHWSTCYSFRHRHSHPQTHSDSYRCTYTRTQRHTNTATLWHTDAQTRILTHTGTLTPTCSDSYRCTHTYTHRDPHTQTPTGTLRLIQTCPHIHTCTATLTHMHAHTLIYTPSRTQTHCHNYLVTIVHHVSTDTETPLDRQLSTTASSRNCR